MRALGLIETYGFIGAIEAADVMLKVANVSLLKLEKVHGGLVTVSIEGDVGAVKVAVEAGASTVQRFGTEFLHSSHVIPRPDQQLSSILDENTEMSLLQDEPTKEVAVAHLSNASKATDKIVEAEEHVTDSIEEPIVNVTTVKEYRRQLERTKAADLRAMISDNENISIAEEKLSSLVRKTMIAMLVDDYSKKIKQSVEKT
ncbi:BMC domain-containing protein [Streptococcus ruminantium]|uniref:BMC domain-containing protein n=1 Tax=Streptococcus ruminantium TaxID=1917441 RepID=A0ABU1B4F1_9STRE|nr:BMC domain-containing protein [Streptococcus ruminantium]MDQ8758828.1 BMC domain-containing protein [Streptococcus ruminantium]MDQ8765419.1 BMC domain-containing protein [Streptococcus ruminantium]MDQ8768254.1 BMC domain-containing protein [Streptococcus ruminantium]MDQ8774666.1 BMC domain-containing protein [Streptococcus ruminantium]MDQ8794628.1 BMC domain-containing protein [Streptococcus ruminantium]